MLWPARKGGILSHRTHLIHEIGRSFISNGPVSGQFTFTGEVVVRGLTVAVGDDACTGSIFTGTHAMAGGADMLFSVAMKTLGNPPTLPKDPCRSPCPDEKSRWGRQDLSS